MRTHHHRPYHNPPMALTDAQLAAVMQAAQLLSVEKRDIYLQRVGALLAFRNATDSDVQDVIRLALCGLIHTANSAA